MAVAAFGDWARSGEVSLAGLDRDGEATLVAGRCAAAACGAFALRWSHRELWAGVILAGGVVAATLGLDNMAEITADAPSSVAPIGFSVAWGLWVTIIGGFALALAAASLFIGLASERRG